MLFSGNVFKYTPLGASGAKNDSFPKPEVSHKKVKIDVFALDIDFKLDLWLHITPLTNFAPKKQKQKYRKCTKKLEKHIDFFIKNNSGRHDAVIASWLRLDR